MLSRSMAARMSAAALVGLLFAVAPASAQEIPLRLYEYDRFGNLRSVRQTDMASDPLHCGSPITVCPASPHGTPMCRSGKCSLRCDPGYLLAANGVCGSIHSPGVTFRLLVYEDYFIPIPAVPDGSIYCDGKFALPASDPAHCGGCGNVCPSRAGATPICNSGTCG